jgi:Protein of unknown function (DUF2938)
MDYAGSALFIGAGATLTTDLWAIARGRLFGVPAPDWGLVGRWLGHMARGRIRHERIATAEPVRGERVIGWTAHYLIGIAFAGGLLAICGLAWARQPTLAPALAFGIATVAAPFLLMQPGMGAGIAASRTPRPNSARLQSLVTHAVFGLGLYAAGLVLKLLSGE